MYSIVYTSIESFIYLLIILYVMVKKDPIIDFKEVFKKTYEKKGWYYTSAMKCLHAINIYIIVNKKEPSVKDISIMLKCDTQNARLQIKTLQIMETIYKDKIGSKIFIGLNEWGKSFTKSNFYDENYEMFFKNL